MTGAATARSSTALADLLAAIVRGDLIAPAAWVTIEADTFCRSAEAHGVVPLIADRLRMTGLAAPGELAARVMDLARRHAALDLERESALRAALAALHEAGLEPLVFKGAHLAYRDYARPDLRPRVDSDVLIPPDSRARDAAHRALTALGYASAPHVGGDLVMTQRMYVLRDGAHVRHAVDVHWRIATPQVFSRVLLYDELVRDAERIPRLGATARGPSGPHALLIACLHRIAHHAGSNCLIWFCDIHRIAGRLTEAEWDRFVRLAQEREVRAVCAASLARAADRLGTLVPDAVRAGLELTGDTPEASARYFDPPGNSVTAALHDLRSLSSWRDRARLIREHLLPPAAYMRRVYAPGSRAPLAWLYVRRLSAGARTWLRSGRTSRNAPDPT